MSHDPVPVLSKGMASEDRSQSSSPKGSEEICEQTGERLFLAGEYVAPGEYVEMETNRCIALTAPGFLPARFDGHVACYRLARPGLPETSDLALVLRQAQFQRLVAQTHTRLYNFAHRALNHPQDAEDVTQEALTRAWTHFETFDPRYSFEAWIFRIASNILIDQSRRRKRRQEISLDAAAAHADENEGLGCLELADSTSDPREILMSKEISAELQWAMRSLPPVHRTTLLQVAQQRSYAQIASTMNCPEGTVRSRVHRARRMLRRTLQERTCNEYASK